MQPLDLETWTGRRAELQRHLWQLLGRPAVEVSPSGQVRERLDWDGLTVEKIIFETEPGQSVPALLYLPTDCPPPWPAVAISMGHGESKTTPGPLLAGPLFARLGIACLCADPLGEEERDASARQGSRAHDAADVSTRSRAVGRKVMGKMVWDLMMGLGYLASRPDIDATRLGCAGVSLGGTVAGYLLALDERLHMAIPSGWFFRPEDQVIGKDCSRIPAEQFLSLMTNGELLGLAAPHCAVLIANGDADTVIDRDGGGMGAVRGLGVSLEQAQSIYRLYDGATSRIGACLEPGGGHRHYYLSKPALLWAVKHLAARSTASSALARMGERLFGDWADAHGVAIEPLYATDLHFRGLRLPDLPVQPLPPAHRHCLTADEIGSDRFTLEGWLRAAERGGSTHTDPGLSIQ